MIIAAYLKLRPTIGDQLVKKTYLNFARELKYRFKIKNGEADGYHVYEQNVREQRQKERKKIDLVCGVKPRRATSDNANM